MEDYKRISTSAEVWAVIHARHRGELVIFSSFSDPDGSFMGNTGEGRMDTTYGFKDVDYAFIGISTTWTTNPEKPYERIDEKHECWLCLPLKSEDD